jgi:hypothetical protein
MGNKVRVSPIMSNVHPMLNQVHEKRSMALPTPRAPKNKVRAGSTVAQPAETASAAPVETPTTGD